MKTFFNIVFILLLVVFLFLGILSLKTYRRFREMKKYHVDVQVVIGKIPIDVDARNNKEAKERALGIAKEWRGEIQEADDRFLVKSVCVEK